MKYSLYPEYKTSGSAWAYEIPQHWEIMRLKMLTREPLKYGANEAAVITDPSLPRYIRITDIQEDGSLRDETFKSLPLDIARPYLLRDGDLLLARSGATAGKTFWYDPKWGTAAYAGYLIRARLNTAMVESKYVRYYTQSIPYWGWLRSSQIQSTIQNVSAERYGNLAVPTPPLCDQRRIIAFLDRETSKIDALIQKKQRLIALLNEKRSALISRAVTKGLDPGVPMRASGVEWIGDVPAHWGVSRLRKYCRSIRDGTHNPPPRAPGEYRLLSVRNIIGGAFVTRPDDRTMTEEAFYELQRSYTVQEGDVVLAIVGATTGKSALVSELDKVTVQRSIAILRPSRGRLASKYLNYWIASAPIQGIIKSICDKYTAQPGIYLEDVADLVLVAPPLSEQCRIAENLDRMVGSVDAITEAVVNAIERLQEYRAALISAAVTGQIDVRNEV